MLTDSRHNETRPSGRIARARRERSGRQAPGRSPWLPVLIGAAAVVVALVIRAAFAAGEPPPVALRVHAVGPAGGPLEGVEVRFIATKSRNPAPAHIATTNAEGVAVLPAERARGDFFCLGTDATGCTMQAFVSQSDPRYRATLEFTGKREITGWVLDERGSPREGVVVEASFQGGPALEHTVTNATGDYKLSCVSRRLPFLTVSARLAGYADQHQDWDAKVGGTVNFELRPSPPLQLRILLPDGKPWSGHTVSVRGHDELSCRTDAEGRCRFEGLDPDAEFYFDLADDALTYRDSGIRTGVGPQVIRFEAPAKLSGRVLDAAGGGVSGVEVRHRHGPRAWVRAKTDSRGRFSIGDLPSGRVVLHYELEDGTLGLVETEVHAGEQRSGFVIRLPRQ